MSQLVERTEQAKRWTSWSIRVNNSFGWGFGRKHSYEGTVPAATVAERRRKDRVARASRKVNR